MKKFSDIRREQVPSEREEEVLEESHPDLPMTILLVRKGIRIFPTGDRVALYTNSKLGVDVSIPYGEHLHNAIKGYGKLTKALEEDYAEIDESYSIMRRLETIANGSQDGDVPMANGANAKVNPVIAKHILTLHSVLTPENQKAVKAMLNGSPKDFAKLANFAHQTAPTIGS